MKQCRKSGVPRDYRTNGQNFTKKKNAGRKIKTQFFIKSELSSPV